MIRPDWIAVDWGTTHLRAFAMGQAGVLAQATSRDGMGQLDRDEFEPALISLIDPWLAADAPTHVVACGMVGSRQGWAEAPYRTVPCTPLLPGAGVVVTAHDPRISVQLIPGLRQMQPADVMRGEETQIAGVLAAEPDFDGVLCLPGTHSKWVRVSAGEVVSFQTYMTGELFSLLSGQSVLRHGMTGDGWDEPAFLAAIDDAISNPQKFAARLFGLRAEGLISGLSPAIAKARLSGLLIGIELAAARPYWLGQDIRLIGAPLLSASYASALAILGAAPVILNADDCTLAGLAAAFAKEPMT